MEPIFILAVVCMDKDIIVLCTMFALTLRHHIKKMFKHFTTYQTIKCTNEIVTKALFLAVILVKTITFQRSKLQKG